MEIESRFDIIEARMRVRTLAREIGLDLFDQARISLATSTLAIILGLEEVGRGTIAMGRLNAGERVGVQVICTRADRALSDLAAGVLDDARRMVDDLMVKKLPSGGIEVTMIKWARLGKQQWIVGLEPIPPVEVRAEGR